MIRCLRCAFLPGPCEKCRRRDKDEREICLVDLDGRRFYPGGTFAPPFPPCLLFQRVGAGPQPFRVEEPSVLFGHPVVPTGACLFDRAPEWDREGEVAFVMRRLS